VVAPLHTGSGTVFVGGSAAALIGNTIASLDLSGGSSDTSSIVADGGSAVSSFTAGGGFLVWSLQSSYFSNIAMTAHNVQLTQNYVNAHAVNAPYVQVGGGALLLFTTYATMNVSLVNCTMAHNTVDVSDACAAGNGAVTCYAGGGGALIGNRQVCLTSDPCVVLDSCTMTNNSVLSVGVAAQALVAGGGGLLSTTQSQLLLLNSTLQLNSGAYGL